MSVAPDAQDVISEAEHNNMVQTWIFRLVGSIGWFTFEMGNHEGSLVPTVGTGVQRVSYLTVRFTPLFLRTWSTII